MEPNVLQIAFVIFFGFFINLIVTGCTLIYGSQ